MIDLDYKLELVLIYLNTVGKDYTYKEITELMGVTYSVVDKIINDMEKKN